MLIHVRRWRLLVTVRSGRSSHAVVQEEALVLVLPGRHNLVRGSHARIACQLAVLLDITHFIALAQYAPWMMFLKVIVMLRELVLVLQSSAHLEMLT